jgi:glycosyltransferase involved in cell wall biosynthesis
VVYGSGLDAGEVAIDQALAERDGFRFESVHCSGRPTADRIRSTVHRGRSRIAREAFRLAGLETGWQIGPSAAELLRRARASNADYFIVHLEQALWAGARLLRDGKRVGVDMEDWFSEDLMPEARRHRPLALLRSLEADLLRGGAHATCPSRAMSDALVREFECAPPAVVYNAFPWGDCLLRDGERHDRISNARPSIHWYSQTIGPGRGLEDLLAALPLLTHDAELHLRGNPVIGFSDWFAARVPPDWRSRVVVHGLVSNDALLSRISEHDIGFAGEMKYCRSRDLTVTNKILHYLLGGLAVVASDTAGQREIAEQARGAVTIYPSGDVSALSRHLNFLLANPERLAVARAAASDAAERVFCWERQEPRLVENVRRAMGEA